MIRKRKVEIKKKKSKIIKKVKPEKIYKYLVNFRFDGDLQKVLVEKEGKVEAFLKVKPMFGGGLINVRIFKDTDSHCLCDTKEEANNKLIECIIRGIKRKKDEIRNLNNQIKLLKGIL